LRQFDLQFGFVRPRPAREDVENQLAAVENLDVECLLDVGDLRGR